jgi:Ser/Thr protein kinase RdoA (MazF antagonist)
MLNICGKTEHIIGVELEDVEVKALRTLCEDHGVKHSDCMRMLLAGYKAINPLPMTPADALRALANGRTDLVRAFILLQHAVHTIDDNAPRDRKLLLWIPNHKYWTIGNWDDDRFSTNPKPFWRHDGETITFSRNNQPSHYTAVPPDVRD